MCRLYRVNRLQALFAEACELPDAELDRFIERSCDGDDVLADELRRRFPTVEIVDHAEFGNLHGADEKVQVGRLPDDLRNRGVDAVVSGMGC